jgi:hypothetical protein
LISFFASVKPHFGQINIFSSIRGFILLSQFGQNFK